MTEPIIYYYAVTQLNDSKENLEVLEYEELEDKHLLKLKSGETKEIYKKDVKKVKYIGFAPFFADQ